ncbi:NYN domain-containing protein [Corynebacterium belfantii]|uniref:NYN domain-containing protein n=1 Tax=Corynebacterium belfantii TaxID=2014537 RepID=UPI0018D37C37|nr:NYN domain-containing protein [Corynebacterium belfantii]MBG9349859.1 NYN domain-containing protein [Corynebacterium belfantii]
MLERTQVFVDTSYLLASFYNSWEIGARAQLEIDLPEVVATLDNMIHNQLGQPVHRQFWYDGIPESGPHRYQRALRTCDGVQLRAGQLIEWGERRTQKAVDTRLVADMVLAGIRREFTDIVLVSGDADMIPGVQEAVNAGVRVHLYGFGWDSMSSALRHACDSTTILDPREDFADCMQLEILEGPLPPVVRNPDEEGELGEFPTAAAETAADTTVTTGTTDTEATPPVPTPEQVAEKNQREVPTAPIPCPQRPGEPALSEEDCMAEVPAKMPNPVAPKPGAHLPVETPAPAPTATPAPTPSSRTVRVTSTVEESLEVRVSNSAEPNVEAEEADAPATPRPAPNPSMMAPRRKLRSRYVPLPNEVWASAGYQTPFDVGQQYALWWFDNAATPVQRDSAHLLSGGGLPPEIDRPLLQFACETLHEYTLTEAQRVGLRDGFHSGIRGVLINNQNS